MQRLDQNALRKQRQRASEGFSKRLMWFGVRLKKKT
jgi:hypothetical protein